MNSGFLAVDDIVDRIYEAALLPHLWPPVLEQLAGLVGAAGGIMFMAADSDIRWTSSSGTAELMQSFVDGGWDKRNSRAARLSAMNYSGFVHDLDIFTHEEIDNDPFYTELCRPRGFGWAAGTIVNIPNGDMLVYSLDRLLDHGPFDRSSIDLLDRLRPHLARAGLLAARLRLERAQSAVGTLAALGLPAAILRSGGKVLAVNPLLEAMTQHVSIGPFDRMHLKNQKANALFAKSLSYLKELPENGVFSFALPSPDDDAAVLHLVPISRSANDIFSEGACIVVVTAIRKPHPPAEGLIGGLFDLSPAEARIARHLACGTRARSIASDLGISYETVRNHVNTVLAKTGTHRQAELIALLAGASIAGSTS